MDAMRLTSRRLRHFIENHGLPFYKDRNGNVTLECSISRDGSHSVQAAIRLTPSYVRGSNQLVFTSQDGKCTLTSIESYTNAFPEDEAFVRAYFKKSPSFIDCFLTFTRTFTFELQLRGHLAPALIDDIAPIFSRVSMLLLNCNMVDLPQAQIEYLIHSKKCLCIREATFPRDADIFNEDFYRKAATRKLWIDTALPEHRPLTEDSLLILARRNDLKLIHLPANHITSNNILRATTELLRIPFLSRRAIFLHDVVIDAKLPEMLENAGGTKISCYEWKCGFLLEGPLDHSVLVRIFAEKSTITISTENETEEIKEGDCKTTERIAEDDDEYFFEYLS